MSHDLLLEIAHCSGVTKCLQGEINQPCKEIVLNQKTSTFDDFQLPEPWSGQIAKAPILFISSNPSISDQEIFPTGTWKDELIVDYFLNRFDGGQKEWIINGTKSLRKDGEYGRATMFWAGVKARAKELLERDPMPGFDYALTELVHCKSREELGVPEALNHCVSRYFQKVLAASNAKVLVGLGSFTREMMISQFQFSKYKNVYGPIELFGKRRLVTFLPHPNARSVRSFEKIMEKSDLQKLRDYIC